ncbi:hypothetical protein AQPE_1927 [Aquipluma nitroreducens]|uniref:Uncharacterized protein n=1 Tax=Aquipluma nitroreducens TaxID=2010828 RepID=A0A5K7S8A7_9BACT|nr:hypothetical protein AQPE_1927 [Aquipluma nitroreducens]
MANHAITNALKSHIKWNKTDDLIDLQEKIGHSSKKVAQSQQ